MAVTGPTVQPSFDAYGPPGGPFWPFDLTVPGSGKPRLTVQNTGTGTIAFSVSTPGWLYAQPSSGTLSAGTSTSVIIDALPAMVAYASGNYSSTISVTNTTNGSGNASFQAALKVRPEATPTIAYDGTLVPLQGQ